MAWITASDYDTFDLIVGMEKYNISGIMRVIKEDPDHKVRMLLDRDIADPWYTGNFEDTYQDLKIGLDAFYRYLLEKGEIYGGKRT